MPATLTELSPAVVARSRNPHMRGFSGRYDAAVRGSNPMCGDDLEVRLSFAERAGVRVVERAAFEGFACSLCTASADALLEHATGRAVDELRLLTPADLEALLGDITVRPARRRCLALPLETLLACLAQA